MKNTLLPTSLVGSYPQPDWLIDREKLAGRFPPRVRATELWRVQPDLLDQAQDDATLLAIRDQERAGLDIITDGEMRRESYSNRFATALEGVDMDNHGVALDRSGHPNPVPRDLSDLTVETPEIVAARIRRALPHVDPANVIVAPDCGLKYLPRDVAFGKMKAMVDGAAIVRRELTGG
jgi:methionine synthase II (cobalamin-independent)